MSHIITVVGVAAFFVVCFAVYYVMNHYEETVARLKDSTKRIILILCAMCLMAGLVACYNIGVNHESKKKTYTTEIELPTEIDKDSFPLHFIDSTDTNVPQTVDYSIELDDYNDVLLLEKGGVYLLSGNYKGCITVDAKDEMVYLLLNNVNIESINGPAVVIENASKVVISSVEGTNNKIADSGYYKNMGDFEACIQSKSNITFNGSGTINVYGLYKDAIRCNDVVKITGGELNIESKKSAIHGSDGINVSDGAVNIASQKYAFKTTKNSSGHKGALIISGGQLNIIAGRFSFVSKADLYIINSKISEKTVSRYNVSGIKYVDEECFK